MVFPNPLKKAMMCSKEEVVVFKKCYCQNGHKLINKQAMFDDLPGIILKISDEKYEGTVALSPVYGCKTKVSLNINLKKDVLYTLSCPECNEPLPIFSHCHCGGDLVILFLNKKGSYESYLGVCNRIGCQNANIKLGDELFTLARLEQL